MSNIQGTGNTDHAERMQRTRNVRGPQKAQPSSGGSTPVQGDRTEISQEARLMSQARDLPSVRQDKVDALKAKINNPDYDVDAHVNDALNKLISDEFGV